MGERLIMFVREAVPGAVKTRLAPSVKRVEAATLYEAFTRDLCAALAPGFRMTLACTPATESTYFTRLARGYRVDLVPQGTGDLGARMRRVATAALATSARVVLIGSDAPTLPPAYVAAAFAALRRRRVVLGPSLDGGYYLLGLRAPVPDVFTGMPWGGARVLTRTLTRLRARRVSSVLLPCWYDVDTPADLALLRRHLALLTMVGASPCPRTVRALARLTAPGRRRHRRTRRVVIGTRARGARGR